MTFSEDSNSILEYYDLFSNEKSEALYAFDELYSLGIVSKVDIKSKTITLAMHNLRSLGFTLNYNLYTDSILFVRIVDLHYMYNAIPYLRDTITPGVFASYSLLKFKNDFSSNKIKK